MKKLCAIILIMAMVLGVCGCSTIENTKKQYFYREDISDDEDDDEDDDDDDDDKKDHADDYDGNEVVASKYNLSIESVVAIFENIGSERVRTEDFGIYLSNGSYIDDYFPNGFFYSFDRRSDYGGLEGKFSDLITCKSNKNLKAGVVGKRKIGKSYHIDISYFEFDSSEYTQLYFKEWLEDAVQRYKSEDYYQDDDSGYYFVNYRSEYYNDDETEIDSQMSICICEGNRIFSVGFCCDSELNSDAKQVLSYICGALGIKDINSIPVYVDFETEDD